MQTLLEQPAVRIAQAGDLRAYQGGYIRILVAPMQTNNAFALIEFTIPRGAEPPLHVHTREDETFYVLEGEITFHVADEVVHATAGQCLFAPRQVPHRFTITSPEARMLTFITPGQFVEYFMTYSKPLDAPCALTPPQGPPPMEAILAMTHYLESEHGVLML